jgi:hypothetical protein
MGRWPWILSFREKKHNSNRAKVVRLVSVLAKVKAVFVTTECINGLAVKMTKYSKENDGTFCALLFNLFFLLDLLNIQLQFTCSLKHYNF